MSNIHYRCCAHILGITNESVVTASHAIFVEKGGYKAPAAVVGLQYKNSAFRETFFNITSGVNSNDLLQSELNITFNTFVIIRSALEGFNADERAVRENCLVT